MINGVENLKDWRATGEAVRRFCSTCGSLLFWEMNGGKQISVFAGSLDRPTGLRLTHHIYCAEKGDYYEIADGLPAHDVR